MTNQTENLLALDVGSSRIGVARGDTVMRIAQPVDTIPVDGREAERIADLIRDILPARIVVGYPRNQSGELTEQTRFVERFVEHLHIELPVVFQDESLTSVIAEQRLKERGKEYTKAMIDAEAAVIILEDYLESNYGH